jgi:hypothetical protein
MEPSGPNAKRERGNVQTKSSNNAPEAAGHSGAIFELITHLSLCFAAAFASFAQTNRATVAARASTARISIHLLVANQTADGEG